MQFLKIPLNTTLTSLRNLVGSSNLEQVLASNSVERTPRIGQFIQSRDEMLSSSDVEVSKDYKITSLNKFSQDSDVFETVAQLSDRGWKILKGSDSLPGTIQVPEGVTLSASDSIIGNARRVSDTVYKKVINFFKNDESVRPEVFNNFSYNTNNSIVGTVSSSPANLFQFFKIPWGMMTIYSSISQDSKDFPVYPEEMQNVASANYTTMPELIYQYEPWQLYTSSGPRSVSYNFTFHRDMWSGDHRDGKANELVRFCEANCYPEYNGSAVNSSLVSLYMNGDLLIRGVLTSVNTSWEGPLGQDGFYLVCKLTLNITEVAAEPLNYWSVMRKSLIG